MPPLLGVALLWLLFGFVHSVLASFALKAFVAHHLPQVYPRYRILYNVLNTALLIWVLGYMANLPFVPLWQTPSAVLWVLLLGMVSGVGVMFRCFAHYNAREFLGFERFGAVRTGSQLNTSGMNAWVRHPLYFGTTLFALCLALHWPSATNLMGFAFYGVYLCIGTVLEERKLVAEFGDAYRDYQKRVPMLIPFPKWGILVKPLR